MTFAEIGTLYNTINNELEGGVTHLNQPLLLQQVGTVQTQLQNLINSGALDNLDGAGNPAISVVHAQNIADQMNFLHTEIGAFGTDTYVPKFINDVVRDVQDIVASDAQLTALAHEDGHAGFEQFSFLLAPPTPFPDTTLQTDTLVQFINDSKALANRAGMIADAIAHPDPNVDPATIEQMKTQLIADVHDFSVNADAYSTEQGGLFSARFNNEFTLNGVQGTASRELITGLETGNAHLIQGAAAVLSANADDVRGNMLENGLGPDGQPFVPAPNGGIPDHIDTVNVAGLVFNDSMTKLIGGVYSGNQQSIVNDLHATATGLQNAITNEGITGLALGDVKHVIGLLGVEASLVGGIDTAAPTPVSAVNGAINHIEAQILNIVNHDPTLHSLAAGTDAAATPGFVPLPPATDSPNHNDIASHFAHLWA